MTCDEENISNMKADVKLIMKGPHPNDGKFYIMSALSDFYGLIEEVLKGNKNDTNLFMRNSGIKICNKSSLKIALKKLDYYLSYALEML